MLTDKGDLTDIGSWYLGGAATGKSPTSAASRLSHRTLMAIFVTLLSIGIVAR